jgi:hypothetical protein
MKRKKWKELKGKISKKEGGGLRESCFRIDSCYPANSFTREKMIDFILSNGYRYSIRKGKFF